MCKWSDPFSKCVLIDRGLDHNSLEFSSQWQNVSSDYSVLKARPSKKHWTAAQKCVILCQSYWSVTMTVRSHLFPFRTQKLSSLVPKIVRWKRRVKIGSRRLNKKALRWKSQGFFVAFYWNTTVYFVQVMQSWMLDNYTTMRYYIDRLLRNT